MVTQLKIKIWIIMFLQSAQWDEGGGRILQGVTTGVGAVMPRSILFQYVGLWILAGLPCIRGARWHSWLRHCATSRKVAGSIPHSVIGSFHWHNPSGRTMVLGLTQPLTEMSTKNISWGGKGCRFVGLTTLRPSCANCLEIWEPQPPGTLRACPGHVMGLVFTPVYTYIILPYSYVTHFLLVPNLPEHDRCVRSAVSVLW